MSSLYVKYSQIENYWSDGEKYGNWSNDVSFEILGVKQTPPDEIFQFEQLGTLNNVSVGDVIYVMTMIYSEGDSFGLSKGKGEILWVFTDPDMAMTAQQKVLEQQDESTIRFYDGLVEVVFSNPGSGYFESVEEVRIDIRKVEA